MKKERSNPLPPEIQTEVDSLAVLTNDQIKTDDIPEVQNWSNAKRGVLYRPIKKQITLRLDADLIDWFRTHHTKDEGYQTSINRALREYVSRQQS